MPEALPPPLLDIRGLDVRFARSGAAPAVAVEGLDLAIGAGEAVAVVGESGSGKSVTALAVMGLVDEPGRVVAQRIAFDGRDLATLTPRQRRTLVGADLAMIFQDPLASLDPCYTVAYQIGEALRAHGSEAERRDRRARRARALELLRLVEIADAEARLDAWPHQLSGGMAQRVMIAIAIACNPRLLIADEPTTALDVTVEAQVLALIARLRAERGMALLLISHDLAVVAHAVSRVAVLYAGQLMEEARVPRIFEAPRHPYTRALVDALPERNRGRARLVAPAGSVPSPDERPGGCLFAPRCPRASARCVAEVPPLVHDSLGALRCFHPLEAA